MKRMAGNKHIFFENGKCVEEVLKSCVHDFSIKTDDKAILSALKIIQVQHIYPCIDVAVWNKIIEYACAETPTDLQKELVSWARITAGYFIAFNFAFKPGTVNEVGSLEEDGYKKRHLDYQKQERNKWNFYNCACDSLEYLIFKLILPNIASFNLDSEPQNLNKFCGLLIHSPEIFTECENLATPGRLHHFLKLKPYLTKAQKHLQNSLCKPFLNELINYQCSETQDDEILNDLLILLREYMAKSALLQACAKGSILFSGNGFKVLDYPDGKRPFQYETKKLGSDLSIGLATAFNEIEIFLKNNKDSVSLATYADCFPDDETDECECPPVDPCENNKNSFVGYGTNSIFI